MEAPLPSPGDQVPGVDRLTEAERCFIRWCCHDEGLSYKQIADRMKLGLCTVHTHRYKVFRKLKVPSRTALVLLAKRLGLG